MSRVSEREMFYSFLEYLMSQIFISFFLSPHFVSYLMSVRRPLTVGVEMEKGENDLISLVLHFQEATKGKLKHHFEEM